ncbi:serine/threonine-protein kinase [Nannocystaceae bacterium ST9]
MNEQPSALRSGSVFGRYVLVEQIGAGAMGEVWVAIDPDLDRKIALKLLRRSRVGRDDNPRLVREARAMARLNHPNVAAVHDVGEVEGRVFIAMEFVAGESLAELITRGPQPWSTILPLLVQAGAGLTAAHAAGIVHRDLKPANVLIGRDGRVRVVDFGLASANRRERPRELGDALQTLPPDRKEAAVGTPAYMAPEQHRGEGFDARSDQFAFCVTAFESLYGRRPFPGEHRYAVALAIVEGRLDDVPPEVQAPAWIHKTLLRGMAPEPGARFPDMLALLDELGRDPARRRRRWLEAGAGVGALVVAIAVWLVWPPRPDPCADAGVAMANTWTVDRRAALEQWLRVGPAEPWREQSGLRLLEGLDARALAWMASDRTVCSDRVAKRATDRMLAARELCLAQQQQAIAGLVELPTREPGEAAEIREQLLARPYALLRALGNPETCAELVSVDAGEPDPARSFAVARANLWLAIDLPELARRELAGFSCTREACDPSLELALARARIGRGELDPAAASLEQIAARSLHDDPDLAVRAWLELARLPGPTPSALDWFSYAEAFDDERLTRTTQIEIALLGASFDLARDRPEDALARLDAALELAARDPPLDTDLEAELLRARAQAHRQRSDLDAALLDEAKARERLELALGAGHPSIAAARRH